MAKKKSSSQPRAAKGSSSVNTNSFIKGMNKDITPSMESDQQWWHARNLVNNSSDGDLGIVGNEPSNLSCGVIPYTVIGAIHRYGDEWVIYSTDDINSEIGLFDDSECKYTTLVNDPCLNFSKKFLITGAAKENFDCSWQVYWDDGNNPSRTLNLDNIPYKQIKVAGLDVNGEPCTVFETIEPKQLDCEQIRLAPLVDTPCVRLEKARDGGMLLNGSYQAFIAYVENDQRVTDYIGISNVQSLWSHLGTGGSLDIILSNIDQDYFYFELVILRRNQGQTSAKRVGVYSTETSEINIDFIAEELINIDLKLIPLMSPAYEKSEAMYVVNDWLIRQGPVEQFDFNYQPIANQIKVNWVVNQVSSDYYYKGGNKVGFMRDEQYAFFIRWIYNTGERSSSYHIPGRPPKAYGPAGGQMEDSLYYGNNVLTPDEDKVFTVFNTASTISVGLSEPAEGGGLIVARGEMGYWESTERYPTRKPDIWNSTYVDPETGVNIGNTNDTQYDLCGKYIRHHKMPTEELTPELHLSNTGTDLINILGVEFTNIGRPKYNDGTYIPNVVGYEILKGSRQGARSILAKGIFRNMREYTLPNAENLIGGNVQGLYPNHPYNDLRPDPYFHDGQSGAAGSLDRTNGCDTFQQSINTFAPLSGYSQSVFTFHSPELMFTKPFLNAYETRLYGQVDGRSSGYFLPSEEHPKFKLLRGGAAIISGVIGVGFAMQQIRGSQTTKVVGGRGNLSSQSGNFGGFAGIGSQPGLAMVGYTAATGGANIASTVLNEVLELIFETAAGVADLYTGGALYYTQQAIKSGVAINQGTIPGMMGGYEETSQETTTKMSSMPLILRTVISAVMSRANIAVGGNEMLELFYNLIEEHSFVWKYNSFGQFTNFTPVNNGLWRVQNKASNYIGSSFQMFDSGDYKINNLFRPETVAVSLTQNIADPDVQDTSRFVVGGEALGGGVVNTFSDSYLLDPKKARGSTISAHYGALKFNMDNQYGQLDGIKQIPMKGCLELLDPDNDNPPFETLYSTKPLFTGDTYIGRFTEKTILPIFSNFLIGQPDGFTFDYSLYVNLPFPRYWLNSQRYDITGLADQIIGFGVFTPGELSAAMPGDLFYLDRGNDSCNGSAWSSIFGNNNDPNPALAMEFAYMYSHTNGILDFFVESEINLDQRDWEEPPAKQIYSVYENNDIDELFHAKIEKAGNFYKYDESLSVSKFPTQLSTFGLMQERDYDPQVAEKCFVSYPKRLIYSLQAQEEARRDFWRVYLNFNYKDFKNAVSVIKPINKSGALIFFPYQSPQMFQGLDQLKTDLGTKLTIGDGGLFSQPFQNVANADISIEYGSSESIRGVINTPGGLFFISQAQGKIFQYGGKGLDPISNAGMKWWFAKYLPSRFIQQFPESENSVWTDNPVMGVGCQVMYDAVDDLVYFMKKDYQVKPQYIASAEFTDNLVKPVRIKNKLGIWVNVDIGDPLYFDDCSWTCSYDPKTKAWISFHDWHPELALPSINHFFTTKTTTGTIPQCPPGYNFNPATGLCEQSVNVTEPAEIIIDHVNPSITGGATNCLLDIVIAMDVSGSTGNPNYTPMQFDANGNQIPGTGIMNGNNRATAQLRWLDVFMNDPNITQALAANTMQIGITSWDGTSVHRLQGGLSMTTTATGASLCGIYQSAGVWTGGGTSTQAAVFGNNANPLLGNGGLALLNDKANSSLAANYPARTQSNNFRQILIVVTDGTSATTNPTSANLAAQQTPNVVSTPPQLTNTGSWAAGANQSADIDLQDATKQEIYGIFCGRTSVIPARTLPLNAITNTYYNSTDTNPASPNFGQSGPPNVPGPNQLTMAANNLGSLTASAQAIAGAVCSIPFVCECPPGYTLVYPDSNGDFNQPTGTCSDIPGESPTCRKVECECPPATIPGTVTTELGDCPDSPPLIYQVTDPGFVSNRECNYFFYESTPPNYDVGGIWRHNVRCDSFANFYNVDYPWEIDIISNTGQAVNTVRSFEYQLETYVYKGDPQYNMCGGDKWEDLTFNFDAAIVYNNDQTSGLLVLNEQPVNDPWGNLTYPIINLNNIDILASKVEHKFRFNQFWDITNDRGEFSNAEQPIFNTECNGYIRPLNNLNLNYNKPETQRKKFRHYSNNVILRRNVSGNRKMLLRLNNTKLLLSQR